MNKKQPKQNKQTKATKQETKYIVRKIKEFIFFP
jgi:hypothetical protein